MNVVYPASGNLILHELYQEAERCPEIGEVSAWAHEAFVHAYAERRLLERMLLAESRVRELEAQ
jgi:hypothetical protein